MRDRLVVAFVTLTLAVVTVFLVERAYTTSDLIHAQEQRKVERSALLLAQFLGQDGVEPTPEMLGEMLFSGEHLVYVAPDGARVEATAETDHDDAAHGESDLTATEDVAGGGTVSLTRHVEVVNARVAAALLPLVLVALVLVVAAAVVALWLSRRLARPFTELAGVAAAIGRGDFDVEVPRYRVPEANEVGRALRTSARELDALVRRERDFAAHASHELRTPITAMRLELEDLALSPQTPPDVVERLSAALGQLDRLSATVAEMLDSSRESRLGSRMAIDLTALVRDAVARWSALAPARRIVMSGDEVVAVRMPPGALIQVMDVLIGNAVTHGQGDVVVEVSRTPAYVEVLVGDQGLREHAAAGTGRPVARGAGGLATATETVEALGGQLRLCDTAHTTFGVVLPTAVRETLSS